MKYKPKSSFYYIFLILSLFTSCVDIAEKKDETFKKILGEDSMNKIDTAYINIVNPYDCINCIPSIQYVINDILLKNDKIRSNTYVVIPKIRKIELNAFKKELFEGNNFERLIIDDKLYVDLSKYNSENGSSSFILIYVPKNNTFKVYNYYDYRLLVSKKH